MSGWDVYVRDVEVDPLVLPIMALDQWVIWRRETRNGKETKVPYQALRPGLRASTTDPRTWASYDDAMKAKGEAEADGVGFAFASGDGFMGIDLDKCRDPQTGTLEDWAAEIIERIPSYTELSPSGTGLHILVRAELPEGQGRKRGKIEMYDRGRYFTFTGRSYGPPRDIARRQKAVTALYEELAPATRTVHDDGPPPPISLSDAEILMRARNARNGAKFSRLWDGDTSGYASQSEAEQAFCNLLAFWVGRDTVAIDRLYRQSGLYRPKWDEKHFGDGRTYGQATASKAASGAQETYSGANGASGIRLEWATEPGAVDAETGEILIPELAGRVLLWPYISGGVPEPEWVIQDVVVAGHVHLFHGEPGCGKTILAQGWMRDLVEAGKRCLFIDEESGVAMVASRFAAMGATTIIDELLHYYPFAGITINDADKLVAYCHEWKPVIVVFDSMADVLGASALDENSSADVTKWMMQVAIRIARETGAAVIILDHNTKDSANTKYSRGSGAKKAKADIGWFVEKTVDFDSNREGRVVLSRTKNRVGYLLEKVTFVVGTRDGRLVVERFDVSQHEIVGLDDQSSEILSYLQGSQPDWVQTGEIATGCNLSKDTVQRRLSSLMERGLVARKGSLGRQVAWAITTAGANAAMPLNAARMPLRHSGTTAENAAGITPPPYRGGGSAAFAANPAKAAIGGDKEGDNPWE